MSDVPYRGSPLIPHATEMTRRQSMNSRKPGPWRPGVANRAAPNAYSAC